MRRARAGLEAEVAADGQDARISAVDTDGCQAGDSHVIDGVGTVGGAFDFEIGIA